MRSALIDKTNAAAIDWEENHFKYCDFEGFSAEGRTISSDFIGCSFGNVDWYWGLFSFANFIDCRFKDCLFQGTTFANCRFVDCELINCRFIKNNLDTSCEFKQTVAYGWVTDGGEGFGAKAEP